jgi:hypothetical protein
MKKCSLILVVSFLFALSSFQPVTAQEKTKAEKDKELNDLILEQKRALVDKQLAQDEVSKALENAKADRERANDEVHKSMEEASKSYEKAMLEVEANGFDKQQFRRGFRSSGNTPEAWSSDNNEPFVFTPGIAIYGHRSIGDSEGTIWEFSKSIKESSFSRDYTFDVDATANTVVMSINGDCKSGEIRIKITMPNGKLYSDILIDESGNLNWRKSFVISESDNKDKTGAWKFDINSTKATGYFKISLQTY